MLREALVLEHVQQRRLPGIVQPEEEDLCVLVREAYTQQRAVGSVRARSVPGEGAGAPKLLSMSHIQLMRNMAAAAEPVARGSTHAEPLLLLLLGWLRTGCEQPQTALFRLDPRPRRPSRRRPAGVTVRSSADGRGGLADLRCGTSLAMLRAERRTCFAFPPFRILKI